MWKESLQVSQEIMLEDIKCNLGVSKIHGIGVFAVRNINKGEELFGYSERYLTLTSKEIESLPEKVKNLILDRYVIYQDTTIIEHPNTEINYVSFMNHSHDPNSNGWQAIRDIKEGEEITEVFIHPDMHEISKQHFKFLFT